MKHFERLSPTWIVLALALACPVAPLRADWLVLTSGEQIETRGEWRVEGARVIFTTTRGVLSSVRTSGVDVEASRTLTHEKEEAAKRVEVTPPPPRREPVMVLTDADFAPARPAAAGAGAGAPAPGGGAEAEAAATAAGAAPGSVAASSGPLEVPAADGLETRAAVQLPGAPSLRVLNWSVRPTGEDEQSILGYVQNVGSLVAAAVKVTVTLIDSEGAEVASSEATLSSSALMPGVQAFFEAKFPGSPAFTRLEFGVSTVELELGREGGGEAQQPAPEASPGTTGEPPVGASELPEAEVRESAPAAERAAP